MPGDARDAAAQGVLTKAIREGAADVSLLSGRAVPGASQLSPAQVAMIGRLGAALDDTERVNLVTYALAMDRAIHLVEQVPCERAEVHALVHAGVRAALAYSVQLSAPAVAPTPLWDGSSRARAAIRTLLDGADPAVAAGGGDPAGLLGYPFGCLQVAVLAWTEAGYAADSAALRDLMEAIAARWSADRVLSCVQDDGTLCTWFALAPGQRELLDPAGLCDLVGAGIHVIVSGGQDGVVGFRAVHREVERTLRVLRVAEPARRRKVTTTNEAGAVALMVDDLASLAEWVQVTLGDLAIDDADHEDLRETLRVYLQRGGSLTRAGRELYLHRNTVLKRVKHARSLTPIDPAVDTAHLQTALEACRLIGAPVLRSA